jgi:hypothetical protein
MDATSVSTSLVSTLAAVVAVWCGLGSLFDPNERAGPEARLVASWDPITCRDPQRIIVELVGDPQPVVGSVPCELGTLALVVPHHGTYRGRVISRAIGRRDRDSPPADLEIDDQVVRWTVTPP